MLLLFEAAHLMTSDSHNVVICPLVESHLVLELVYILLWGKNLKKNMENISTKLFRPRDACGNCGNDSNGIINVENIWKPNLFMLVYVLCDPVVCFASLRGVGPYPKANKTLCVMLGNFCILC